MRIINFILSVLVIVAIIFFIIFVINPNAFGQDYSNDFEYNMMEWESAQQQQDYSDYKTESFTGKNSPSAVYNSSVKEMEYRKAIENLNRRLKYEYRPLSPNKLQHRIMTKTND